MEGSKETGSPSTCLRKVGLSPTVTFGLGPGMKLVAVQVIPDKLGKSDVSKDVY